MEKKLEFSVRNERDTVIVDVAGRIIHENSPLMRKTMLESLRGTQRLAINLTLVDSIDSSGIASLVEVLKEGRKSQKRVIFFGVTGHVLEVLELTHLTRVFEICETEAQALEA